MPSRTDDLSEAAWTLAYRGLDHGALRNACRNVRLTRRDGLTIARFTDLVPKIQAKRHLADYDPRSTLTATEVSDDIDQCEAAIHAFTSAPESERRAFVAFVLFKTR